MGGDESSVLAMYGQGDRSSLIPRFHLKLVQAEVHFATNNKSNQNNQPNRLVRSIKEIKFTFEEFGGEFGFEIPSFSIDGYNARNVDLTIYSSETARTTFDIYDYDQWVATGVSRTWVNVEGKWYNDGLTCRGIGGG